jgi:hypothetical protein
LVSSNLNIPISFPVKPAYLEELPSITTKDYLGITNGYLRNLLNINDGITSLIEQVYITSCAPGQRKGPHVHLPPKTDRFYCIGGKGVILCRNEQTGDYKEFYTYGLDNILITIPPYNSHCLIASGKESFVVLSMPTEGYNPGKEYNQLETNYENFDWDTLLRQL